MLDHLNYFSVFPVLEYKVINVRNIVSSVFLRYLKNSNFEFSFLLISVLTFSAVSSPVGRGRSLYQFLLL